MIGHVGLVPGVCNMYQLPLTASQMGVPPCQCPLPHDSCRPQAPMPIASVSLPSTVVVLLAQLLGMDVRLQATQLRSLLTPLLRLFLFPLLLHSQLRLRLLSPPFLLLLLLLPFLLLLSQTRWLMYP